MQSLHLKIIPTDAYKNANLWMQEDLEILERFFEAKVFLKMIILYVPNEFHVFYRWCVPHISQMLFSHTYDY